MARPCRRCRYARIMRHARAPTHDAELLPFARAITLSCCRRYYTHCHAFTLLMLPRFYYDAACRCLMLRRLYAIFARATRWRRRLPAMPYAYCSPLPRLRGHIFFSEDMPPMRFRLITDFVTLRLPAAPAATPARLPKQYRRLADDQRLNREEC